MKKQLRRLTYSGTATFVSVVVGVTGLANAVGPQTFQANLSELNNSGANGTATIKLDGSTATVTENINGVVEGVPHAQHLYFLSDSTHTCPTGSLDKNNDGLVSALEGAPAYGNIQTSLTTSGDMGADSTLAFARFPSAPNGSINYQRSFKVSDKLAKAIKAGQVAVVVHGIDANNNTKYDGGTGTSPLAKSLKLKESVPLEETAPAACGVLSANNDGQSDGNTTTTVTTTEKDGNSVILYIALGLGVLGVLLGIIALAAAAGKRQNK